MPLEDFIITAFCLVADVFEHVPEINHLRSRGFSPSLSNAEVITVEIIGEFMGIDGDKGIWQYFKTHWYCWFPGLGSRSNFGKQAAHLWRVKQIIQQRMANYGFKGNLMISSEGIITGITLTAANVDERVSLWDIVGNIQKVRARSVWHLTNRITRKVLSHTVAVLINKSLGNPPLQFEKLVLSKS